MKTKNLLVSGALGLLAVGAGTSAQADYKATVLGDNPAAYWRFNETPVVTPAPAVGTVALNLGSGGAALNGSYVGRFAGVAGAIAGNSAVNFYNSTQDTKENGSMDVPYNASLNPSGPFTIEFWAKANNDTASLITPVNAMSFSPGRAGYLFYQNGNTWQFRIGYNGSTTASTINGGTILPYQWQHVVGTFSGGVSNGAGGFTNGTMTLFVNGVQVNSGPVAIYEPNTTANLRIGRTSAPNREFDGAVDEVAVYGSALSASTIAGHYAARTTNAANYATQIGLDAPVGYWRLDELTKLPVAANSSAAGTSKDGLYNYWSTTAPDLQGPTYPGFEPSNTALQLYGTNGFASMPALGLNSATVTMECWIKRNGSQASFSGILFHRGGGGTATGMMFRDTSNEIGYHWNDTQYGWISGLTPPDGAWAYIALAVSPDKAVMYMYDGTTWSSAANVTTHAPQGFNATTFAGSDQDSTRWYNGLLDEAAIYGKTLTEGQLRTHALAGFGDPSLKPPTFVSDPPTLSPSGTIYTTTPFSLTSDVYGEPPLTFQWRHAGTNLPGATAMTYTRAAAVSGDAGDYVVVVGNAYGSVTSSVVTVTINPAVPPTISTQPASRLVYSGGAASFTVAASGTAPFTYQWKHAGTNLPGATSATLLVTNCGPAETGTYTVGVTNVAGGVASLPATLTISTPTPGTFAEKVITNRPLAYWRLNEGSGTVAFDYAGGNDGAVTGTATLATPSPASPTYAGMEAGNTGYNLDGTSGCVIVGNPAALNFAGQITMTAWVRPLSTDGLRNILCHGYQTSPNNSETGLRINAGVYQLWSWDGGVEASYTVPAEDIGNWVHLVGTHDGSAWHLYRNGLEVASGITAQGAKVASSVGWAIGARGTGTERFFGGDIDEVAIYNRALSAATIADMYAAATYGSTTPPLIVQEPASRTFYKGLTGKFSVIAGGSMPLTYQWKHAGTNLPGATTSTLSLPNLDSSMTGSYQVTIANTAGTTNSAVATLSLITPAAGSFEERIVANGPVGYWRLGEASGTTAYDYAGGNDATYYSVIQGQPGAVLGDPNGAAQFDGTSSYVSTGKPLLNNRTAFTVMGWLKRGATHSTRGGYFGQNNLLEFGDASSGTSIEAWIDATGGNIVTPWPWPDDQWGFIVLTGDGTVNTLYVDGVAVGSRNATVPSYGANGFAFNIGGGGIFNDPAVNMDYFNGWIDDVALFDKPLSAATVAEIYAAGLFSTTTPPLLSRDLPPSATATVGTALTLSASFKGSLPLTYQWQKDGVNISGATSATLTLSNIYFTAAGSYVLWASNGAGTSNTSATVVSVMPPPSYALATNDLVLHMPFEDNYDDTSGLGNFAYAIGTPTFLDGRIGRAVHIATTPGNNYVQVSDASVLQFYETNSFTVGFWVKYTGGFNDVPIIGNAVNSTYQLGWVFTDGSTAGRLEWSLVSTANSGTYLRDPVSNTVIGNGAWHHVLGVVDRQQQLALAYIDGTLVSSWSIAGLGSLYYYGTITIGQDPSGNYGNATFDMDDLGIWRRPVSSYEAAGIYAAGQSGMSFDAKAPVKVYISNMDGNVDISWQAGTLLQATSVNGPYTPVPGAVAPFYRTTPTGTAKFYRVSN